MITANLINTQVWVATTPVDMRKSFDGLAEVVRSFLGHDPTSGSLFVFRNRGCHLAKVLWWDRDGLAIYYKRLERGDFLWPRSNTTARLRSRAKSYCGCCRGWKFHVVLCDCGNATIRRLVKWVGTAAVD